MQHIAIVGSRQRFEQIPADGDRIPNRQRALLQSLLKRDARNERHDQIDLIVVRSEIQQRCELLVADLGQDVRLMLKPHLHRCRKRRSGRRLDDNLGTAGEIRCKIRSGVQAVFQRTQHLVATGNQPLTRRFIRETGIRLRTSRGRRHAHLALRFPAVLRNIANLRMPVRSTEWLTTDRLRCRSQ